MNSQPNDHRRKHQRIKAACLELEAAIENFEDDTEAQRRAHLEAEKIKVIKERLDEIKRQIEEFSL